MFLEVISQADLGRSGKLYVLQGTECGRRRVVAIHKLLGGSVVGDVIDVQVCFDGLSIGNPDLPSRQRVPLNQPGRPDLARASVGILEAVSCRQRIGDYTAIDGECGWTVLPGVWCSQGSERCNNRSAGCPGLRCDCSRKTDLPRRSPGTTGACLIALPHPIT